jgi:hypothetical protein
MQERQTEKIYIDIPRSAKYIQQRAKQEGLSSSLAHCRPVSPTGFCVQLKARLVSVYRPPKYA